jgi:hypothetical protein
LVARVSVARMRPHSNTFSPLRGICDFSMIGCA